MLEKLKKQDFYFKKKFGQNFLTDTNLLRSICSTSKIDKDTNVLEIGAGAGSLTQVLTEEAKYVVSYEIDRDLQPLLSEKFVNKKNIELVFKDFMKENMAEVESKFDGKYSVVANIPYYITTPLIFKIIEEGKNVQSLVLVVQKEVGERFTAKPGTKEYGAVNVMINYYGSVKVIKNISRKMFTPEPDVNSCVIEIDLVKNKFNVDEKLFEKCVKAAFNNRRKVFIKNLTNTFDIPREKFLDIFNELKLAPDIRGEKLSVEQFVQLAKTVEETISKK